VQAGTKRLRAELLRSGLVTHFVRCNAVGFLLVGTVIAFWWGGARIAEHAKSDRTERQAANPPRQRQHPQISKAVDNNNKAAELKLPPDLDGTAVIYPEEVDALVRPDGTFRTSLPLGELARLLKVEPEKIAKKGSRDEIDPDAVLFNVVTGKLSEKAKTQARRTREIQARIGLIASAVDDEWLETKIPCSLNILLHPGDDQKPVFEAICRSALRLPRQPGAKFNAVPLLLERDGEHAAFSGGFLPLEPSRERVTTLADANR
jgi:hypothetical protein